MIEFVGKDFNKQQKLVVLLCVASILVSTISLGSGFIVLLYESLMLHHTQKPALKEKGIG